jgi:hypothetical protein
LTAEGRGGSGTIGLTRETGYDSRERTGARLHLLHAKDALEREPLVARRRARHPEQVRKQRPPDGGAASAQGRLADPDADEQAS